MTSGHDFDFEKLNGVPTTVLLTECKPTIVTSKMLVPEANLPRPRIKSSCFGRRCTSSTSSKFFVDLPADPQESCVAYSWDGRCDKSWNGWCHSNQTSTTANPLSEREIRYSQSADAKTPWDMSRSACNAKLSYVSEDRRHRAKEQAERDSIISIERDAFDTIQRDNCDVQCDRYAKRSNTNISCNKSNYDKPCKLSFLMKEMNCDASYKKLTTRHSAIYDNINLNDVSGDNSIVSARAQRTNNAKVTAKERKHNFKVKDRRNGKACCLSKDKQAEVFSSVKSGYLGQTRPAIQKQSKCRLCFAQTRTDSLSTTYRRTSSKAFGKSYETLPKVGTLTAWRSPCLCFLWFLLWCSISVQPALSSWWFLSQLPIHASGTGVLCDNIPGLVGRQKRLCRHHPDVMVPLAEGARLGIEECQFQFRAQRWNCTTIHRDASVFGKLMLKGSREASFVYAISSAGVVHAITRACSKGQLNGCACDPTKRGAGRDRRGGFDWGGCSDNVRYGGRFARMFVDAKERKTRDARALMNLHNNRAGRRAVKKFRKLECKCHGVSGSCTIRTCWLAMQDFRRVGNYLKTKHNGATQVTINQEGTGLIVANRNHKKPTRSDLVYFDKSPDYCLRDSSVGSLGTAGRTCNKTSLGTDGCDIMCCGRGYDTKTARQVEKCECKFHWCCFVHCKECKRLVDVHTCKGPPTHEGHVDDDDDDDDDGREKVDEVEKDGEGEGGGGRGAGGGGEEADGGGDRGGSAEHSSTSGNGRQSLPPLLSSPPAVSYSHGGGDPGGLPAQDVQDVVIAPAADGKGGGRRVAEGGAEGGTGTISQDILKAGGGFNRTAAGSAVAAEDEASAGRGQRAGDRGGIKDKGGVKGGSGGGRSSAGGGRRGGKYNKTVLLTRAFRNQSSVSL